MAKTKFILEADQAKAVGAFLKVVDAQKKTERGMRNINREGAKTNKTMAGIGRSVAGWLGGFASIAGVVRGLQAINAEMEKSKRLRGEMYQVAQTTEQLSLKIAHLRKDVSESGLGGVTKDIAEISRRTAASLESVTAALFYAESAMGAGTPAAKAAALTISKFAAPAGLVPEEVKLLPKIFDIMKADTEKKQMAILNQLRAATGASIAETGEFIQPFIRPLVGYLQRGFTFPQAAGRMVGAIQVAGTPEEAATVMRTALDIGAGRTEKAMKFYGAEARKRGIDYGTLADPERFAFAQTLFQEAEKKGPATMDRLKVMVGAKGFEAMRRMFGEAAQRKYMEVFPEIEAAATATDVQNMAQLYQKLLSAEKTGRERRVQLGATRIGREMRPSIVYRQMTEDILRDVHAQEVGITDYMRGAFQTDIMQESRIGHMMLRENLALALEQTRGRPEEAGIRGLIKDYGQISYPTFHPEFMGRAYQATGGFGMVEEAGRFAEWPTMEELYRIKTGGAYGGPGGIPISEEGVRPEYYMRGLETHYGISEESAKKIVESLDRLNDTLQQGSAGVGGPNDNVLD